MDECADYWWAVQVRTRWEQLAATHLRLRQYEVFLPCYRERRRWSDRFKEVERPLFPGYLFCHVTQAKLGNLITAPAVIRIVGDSRRPLPIPQSEVDAVRRIVEAELPARPWPFVQVGQAVRVEVGPLRGLEGIVLTTTDNRRLIVSLPLLQRSVAVSLNADWVSVPAPNARCASRGGPQHHRDSPSA